MTERHGERDLWKWTARGGTVLLVAVGLVWAGAKVHFFSRYGVDGLEAFVAEHWRLWAGMAFLGLVLVVLDSLRERKAGGVRRPGE